MDQATNLRNIIKQQEVIQHTSKIITVTSGKGGVGKSSLSINLAICLSKLNNRVVILDADFGLANIEVMLGVRPQNNLAGLMYGGKSLKDIITPGPFNIGLISGGSGIAELTNLDNGQFANVANKLVELDEIADYVIVDTGAGISDGLMKFIEISNLTLLVATPEPTSITDAYAVMKSVNRTFIRVDDKPIIKMIANRVASYEEGKELYAKLHKVVSRFLSVNLSYLGGVLQDSSITKAVMAQNPITIANPNSPAAKTFMDIATMIHHGEQVEQKDRGGIRQLFTNMRYSRY